MGERSRSDSLKKRNVDSWKYDREWSQRRKGKD
jgi:hypothetical protein